MLDDLLFCRASYCSFHWGDLFLTPPGVFIQRDIELLNQMRVCVLDEVWVVLCIMFAGFGAVVSEFTDILVSDHLRMPGFLLLPYFFLDLWIKILPMLILQLEQPSHVVYTGNNLGSPFQILIHSQILE